MIIIEPDETNEDQDIEEEEETNPDWWAEMDQYINLPYT